MEAAVLGQCVGHGGQHFSLVLELQFHVLGWSELGQSRIHDVLPILVLGSGDCVRRVYRHVVRMVDPDWPGDARKAL
jgi:hypothetical protein